MKKIHSIKRFFFIMIVISSSVYALVDDLILQLDSGTEVEINNVVSPTVGSLVFNTDDQKVYTYDGTQWNAIEGDEQSISGSNLSGTTLTIGIENGTAQSVDLAPLVNDADADSTNEIQTLSISGQDISLSMGGGTVTVPSETTTTLSQDNSSGVITYTSEDGSDQTANVVSSDTDNQVIVGTDGGAYVGPTVYNGYFTISSAGNLVVSGLPFQPSQITFVAHANVESTNIDADNGTSNNDRGIANSFGTMNGFVRDDSGTITQQVIYVGGHGNSINDISRYASSSNCIGVRYGDQNGADLGKITASFGSFNTNGFTINVAYTSGATSEGLVVLFTAYK